MARPLRIELAGAWYHVMNRGHRGNALFRDDADRRRFLCLVAELPERFGLEIHALVLMQNHYHLLVRTGEANLSQAVRWLNVSYAVKFNWAHGWRGTVFAGRFKAVLIQEERRATEVARYLHLNPARIEGLGLSKSDQRRAKVTGCKDPGRELVNRRLEVLREYRWSSWRVYAGAEPAPGWLETGVISSACGGRTQAERRAALRVYTEEPVRQGRVASPWEGLVGGVVLGEAEYARRVMAGRKVNEEEQTEARRMRRRVSWGEVVKAAETVRGGRWEEWAVRHGGLRLAEVVREAKGLRYQAAAQAVKRFAAALPKDAERRRFVLRLRRELSII
jgi:REP-associated tyrosine transposase